MNIIVNSCRADEGVKKRIETHLRNSCQIGSGGITIVILSENRIGIPETFRGEKIIVYDLRACESIYLTQYSNFVDAYHNTEGKALKQLEELIENYDELALSLPPSVEYIAEKPEAEEEPKQEMKKHTPVRRSLGTKSTRKRPEGVRKKNKFKSMFVVAVVILLILLIIIINTKGEASDMICQGNAFSAFVESGGNLPVNITSWY